MFLLLLYTTVFLSLFFFFNDTATTEIYTLSLHDALPILSCTRRSETSASRSSPICIMQKCSWERDRKSTRLNSSHLGISYAVFCLKKKKKKQEQHKSQDKNDSLTEND